MVSSQYGVVTGIQAEAEGVRTAVNGALQGDTCLREEDLLKLWHRHDSSSDTDIVAVVRKQANKQSQPLGNDLSG